METRGFKNAIALGLGRAVLHLLDRDVHRRLDWRTMFRLQHLDRKFLVGMRFPSVLGAMVIVALILIGATAHVPTGPSRSQRPSFAVASVRAHDPNDIKDTDNFQPYPGGRFTASNCSLWMLIHYAFRLQPYQITGIPRSADSGRMNSLRP